MEDERIDKLWNFGDPAATEKSFRALLDDPAYESGTASRAELMTQVARTQGLQRKFDEARKTLADVDPHIFEELGECLLALNRAGEAKPWFAKAHAELSKDDWLVANEMPRIDRLAELGK